MSDDLPERPSRRPRYPGKNPRQFHEKYKELAPEKYADEVAKIAASGKTPAGSHRSIMVNEILRALSPQPGDVAIDCTLGFGGHTRAILDAVLPGGKVIGFDVDPIELPRTVQQLRQAGYSDEAFVAVRANFAGIAQFIPVHAPEGADLILADLGLSSMQIDNPERGFTFKADGPLDMRMNPDKGRSAAELLDVIEKAELAKLLVDYADEPAAALLATIILQAHSTNRLQTTRQLADVIRDSVSRRADADEVELSVRRVFQALRIAVNDELAVLDAFLNQLPWCLKPGGRVAILTFHSGEDRRVKSHFKDGLHAGWYSDIADNVIRASGQERRDNPRSSSAKLRWAVRSQD